MFAKLIRDYCTELKKCLDEITVERVLQMSDIIYQAYQQDRYIFVMGNGGSASTAAHFACDINKGVSLGLKKRFKVICLNDNIPMMLAYANDISYEDIFVEQLKNFFEPSDLVMGISASGNSKNILKAIQFANKNGGQTIGLSGFDGGQLAKLAKIPLVISVNDMQQIEDIHLMVTHILMKILDKKLKFQTNK